MHEDNNPIGAWILYAFASFLLWIVLIFLKLLGVVRISWIGVVLGLFWLPLALMCLICGVAALIILTAHIKESAAAKRQTVALSGRQKRSGHGHHRRQEDGLWSCSPKSTGSSARLERQTGSSAAGSWRQQEAPEGRRTNKWTIKQRQSRKHTLTACRYSAPTTK